MDNCKVTILMPAYNASRYIGEAIQSVLAQTFQDFELLIINDGSTDNTVEVIRSYPDRRIVLIQQENKGVAAALNTGLSLARAPYIARFDADDTCLPERIQKQYDFISSNPEYIVVGSSAEYTDALGNYIFTYQPPGSTNEEIRQLPVTACPFIHSSVIYKKEVIRQVEYNIHAYSFEDHLLWKQISNKGKMCNLKESLIRVRLNPTSLTMDEKMRPKIFHDIKHKTLNTGEISAADSEILLSVINKQNNTRDKEGAYYALLAKKFLWNNYNPSKARKNIRKVISVRPTDAGNYLLWLVSFLPKRAIGEIYNFSKHKY